jgi:hypothetical protein
MAAVKYDVSGPFHIPTARPALCSNLPSLIGVGLDKKMSLTFR